MPGAKKPAKRAKTTANSQKEQTGTETTFLYTPETALGIYANVAFIRHTADEFQLDFLQQDPAGAHQLAARIWTSPAHYKRLAGALVANLEKYEKRFGKISEQKPEKAD